MAISTSTTVSIVNIVCLFQSHTRAYGYFDSLVHQGQYWRFLFQSHTRAYGYFDLYHLYRLVGSAQFQSHTRAYGYFDRD